MKPQHSILVIDDQVTVREVITDLLMEFELSEQVRMAGSIKEARQVLTNKHWDAVITDMSLGDGNILDLIDDLRQQGHALPPILLISGFLYDQSMQRARSLGIKHILTKPFLPNDLLDCLQHMLASNENAHG